MLVEISNDYDENDILYLYNLVNYLSYYKIICHLIIKNKFNSFITFFNDKKYVLLKIYNNESKYVTINDINRLSNINIANYYNDTNWGKLWGNKIDYIEELINDNKNTFKTINSYIDYPIGLAEIGIKLFNKYKIIKQCNISHKRIYTNTEVRDLYNPFNIVIDHIERDYAELYKNLFFKSSHYDVINFINESNIKDLKLFFIRLLFVSPYFDTCFEIIRNKKEEKEIFRYVTKFEEYEKELKKVYLILKNRNLIEQIEFFTK